jgi:hypothetical protein
MKYSINTQRLLFFSKFLICLLALSSTGKATSILPEDFNGELDIPMLREILGKPKAYNRKKGYSLNFDENKELGTQYRYQARRLNNLEQIDNYALIRTGGTERNKIAPRWFYKISNINEDPEDSYVFSIKRINLSFLTDMNKEDKEHYTTTHNHQEKFDKDRRVPSTEPIESLEKYFKRLEIQDGLDSETLKQKNRLKELKKKKKFENSPQHKRRKKSVEKSRRSVSSTDLKKNSIKQQPEFSDVMKELNKTTKKKRKKSKVKKNDDSN